MKWNGYTARYCGVWSWCKTKAIALASVARLEEAKRLGYWGCPCGSDKQARGCCGIPRA